MYSHNFIEPHQVNTFVYCKRSWYYHNRLKMNLQGEEIKIGQIFHSNHWLQISKRKEVYFLSEKLRIKGKCDYILEENNTMIPLELKKGRCRQNKPYTNDIMQLLCYILLIEEKSSQKCDYGYILYASSKKKFKVLASPQLRSDLYSYLKSMRAYIHNGKIPKGLDNEKLCGKCSFKEYCRCSREM